MPAPNKEGEYVLTLKAVRADVSNVSLATSREIYATATPKNKGKGFTRFSCQRD